MFPRFVSKILLAAARGMTAASLPGRNQENLTHRVMLTFGVLAATAAQQY